MKRGRLRAVDEAILQRDAKAAPQEALSFRPPDNSPFRRHFTRGFLLCLYAYSTRFAWECQCPFCTNPLGASLCRLRDARSGGGRDFRFGRDGERKACLRTDKGAGELNILCTPSIRPRFPARRRTARAFFACRREETAFLPRTGEPTALSVRCRTDCVSLIRRRTDVRENAARQDAPAARRFFAGSDLLRLFAEQPSDQRAQQARRTEAVNFQKNQPLPFYVISKRA